MRSIRVSLSLLSLLGVQVVWTVVAIFLLHMSAAAILFGDAAGIGIYYWLARK